MSLHRHVFNIPEWEENGNVTIFYKACVCGARKLSPESQEPREREELID